MIVEMVRIWIPESFHQCTDADLVQRVSGLRQHPETGQIYNADQWKREDVVYCKKVKEVVEEDEDEMEDEEEDEDSLEEQVTVALIIPVIM